jgi:hypothetical protein
MSAVIALVLFVVLVVSWVVAIGIPRLKKQLKFSRRDVLGKEKHEPERPDF